MKCSINAALVALTLKGWAAACPMCKDSLEANVRGAALGYNWSILLMLSVTFTVVGVIAGSIYWSVRKAGKKAGSGGA